jgi:uncharacterized phage-associated protein
MPHRFIINWKKCIEGIHFLADRQPGITPYYIAKIFFFADKAHLIDWGRPISGDRYVAMENGPVPSGIYDLIKRNEYLADDLLDDIDSRLEKRGRAIHPRQPYQQRALSRTDAEYLHNALVRYGRMSFDALKHLSHQERSWQDAWRKPGINNEMDPLLLIEEETEGREAFVEEIKRKTAYAA